MEYFSAFPKVKYDIKKNGNTEVMTNVMLRFKIRDLIRSRASVFHEYTIQEGERPDIVAFKYYDDPTLDWVIMIINNILDPLFDWPLSYRAFNRFITEKYGSVSNAQSQVHHYEWIYQPWNRLFDGTIIDEEVYEVDLTTYNTLDPLARRIVYAYDYHQKINDSKRNIKILDNRYLQNIIQQYETVFN